jgi:hypothetical protein
MPDVVATASGSPVMIRHRPSGAKSHGRQTVIYEYLEIE